MNQVENLTESEQQLKIWKDLAISKQMMMNEAASSLKLKPEWTQEELKTALDHAIKRGNEAEDNMNTTRAAADKAISEMEEKVRLAEKARSVAEEEVGASQKAQSQAEQQLANGRKDNADALKKTKQQVLDKDRELKAINTALADTPENVLKKLKTLKRQKHDEAQARTRAEETNRKLKKEAKALEESLEEQKKLAEQGSRLAEHYKELLKFCEEQQETLKSANTDAEIVDIPVIDSALLEAFEEESEAEETTQEAAHA